MDGWLGVAGMMTLLVMTGITPENSLRLAPVSYNKNPIFPGYQFLVYLEGASWKSEVF